jgi:hypothetical protein
VVVLLFTVGLGVAALTALVSVLPASAAASRVAGVVILLLAPSLLVTAALYGGGAARAIRDRLAVQDDGLPQPTTPPIEKLAADLRRLLWNHDDLMQSRDATPSALRLRALLAAISICATQAARALEVPHPDPVTDAGLDTTQLRRLLRSLAAAGLVLPAIGLLAPDGSR